jgi:uncharacterized membrane protein
MKERLDMDMVIGYLLEIGVLGSLLLILGGYLWKWLNTGGLTMAYSIPGKNLYRLWADDFHQALSGAWRPRLLVNMGIALLLATPYFRVFVSFLYFALVQRNLKYTVFTLMVFSGLTYSLFFSF